jgi:hypothetical protein
LADLKTPIWLDYSFASHKLQLGPNGELSLAFLAFPNPDGASELPVWITVRTADGALVVRKDLLAEGDPPSCDAGSLVLRRPEAAPVSAPVPGKSP